MKKKKQQKTSKLIKKTGKSASVTPELELDFGQFLINKKRQNQNILAKYQKSE